MYTEGEQTGDPYKLSEAFKSTLDKIDGVEQVDNVYYKFEKYTLDDTIRASLKPQAEVLKPEPFLVQTLKNNFIMLDLYGIDGGWYDLVQKDVIEGTFDKQKFASGNYVLVTEAMMHGEDTYETYYHPGDTIKHPGLGKSYEVMAVLKLDALYAATTQSYPIYGYNTFLPASELTKALPHGKQSAYGVVSNHSRRSGQA